MRSNLSINDGPDHLKFASYGPDNVRTLSVLHRHFKILFRHFWPACNMNLVYRHLATVANKQVFVSLEDCVYRREAY